MNTHTLKFNATPIRNNTRETPAAQNRTLAEHKWILSERLGRDVGWQVAELDYRLNLAKDAVDGEKTNWFFRLLERLAASHGMRAFAHIQLTTRSLYAISAERRAAENVDG